MRRTKVARSLVVAVILGSVQVAAAQVASFTSEDDFHAHMLARGNTLLGVEDFEDIDLMGNASLGFDAVSLTGTGMMLPGLVASVDVSDPFTPDVGRGDMMAVNEPAPFFGLLTQTLTAGDADGEGTFDLHFGELTFVGDVATVNFDGGRAGVGFLLLDIQPVNSYVIRVFGADGTTLLTDFIGVAAGPGGVFFGIASDVPIGRINLHKVGNAVKAVDDIQMWAPAGGCEADLDGNQMVDVFDLLAYLDLWFVADAAAEMTGDDPATVDVFDLLAYLDWWFAGC